MKFGTEGKLTDIEFVKNDRGKSDIAVFDFTSLKKSEHAARIVERKGHRLLLALVGDSLIEVCDYFIIDPPSVSLVINRYTSSNYHFHHHYHWLSSGTPLQTTTFIIIIITLITIIYPNSSPYHNPSLPPITTTILTTILTTTTHAHQPIFLPY